MKLVSRVNRLLRSLNISYALTPVKISRTCMCAWCGDTIEWTGGPLDERPTFCSKGHREKARLSRNRRFADGLARHKPENTGLRYSTGTAKACPRPEKERHNSFFEAWDVINQVDKTMHPYRCRCGYIHIGH